MVVDVKGHATLVMKEDLVPHNFVRRDPREDGVVIDILYSGVCHSDTHNACNDWGGAKYPVVPGHEIIGCVTHIGKSVTKFKVGDLARVGCMVDSYQHCSACEQGLEQYCEGDNTLTYSDIDCNDGLPTFGGYSDKIIVTEKFVAKVSEGIGSRGTAPLLCVGITTWSSLRHWQVGEGNKVAVVGLGGLGRMAIKLANALGAEVTLFTHSPGKEVNVRRLGVSHVVLSTDSEQVKTTANQFDLIIDTVPYVHGLNPYTPTLVLSGTLVLVGYLGALGPLMNTVLLIFGRRSMAGSVIGGIAETREMMDFCGQHGITANVEVIDIQDTNHAWQRMLKSDVKYRFVIDIPSSK